MPGSLESDKIKRRCLGGDNDAWRQLYRDTFVRAKAIAQAPPFLFDAAMAADIAQDVVVELTRKLADIQNIMGFVGRVTHNKCVDRVRKKKESPFSSLDDENPDGTNWRYDVEGPAFLPEVLDDHRILAVVRESLSALGAPCRQLLYGRFFDELTYADMAISANLPANQVGVYVSRCLDRLRRTLEQIPGIWAELEGLLRT